MVMETYTNTATSNQRKTIFKPLPDTKKNFYVSGTTGNVPAWFLTQENATIELPFISENVGKTEVAYKDPETEMDIEDIEITRMSDEELLAEVMALSGIWADRDDLDEIMDRRDRIDELYAPYDSESPDTSI